MNPSRPPSTNPPDEGPAHAPERRKLLWEALAATFMMLGAVALVVTLFPWINATQYRLNAPRNVSLAVWGLIGSGATIGLLWTAFIFNRRAKRGIDSRL